MAFSRFEWHETVLAVQLRRFRVGYTISNNDLPYKKTLVKHKEDIYNKLLRNVFYDNSSSKSRCAEPYLNTIDLLNRFHNDLPHSKLFISTLLAGIWYKIQKAQNCPHAISSIIDLYIQQILFKSRDIYLVRKPRSIPFQQKLYCIILFTCSQDMR